MPKPHPASIEKRLIESAGAEAVDCVRDWLLSGLSYRKVLELIEKTFSIKTSLAGLSGFHSREVEPFIVERRRSSARLASQIVATSREIDANAIDEAALLLLKENILACLSNDGLEEKERASAVKALIALRGQDLDREKLREKMQSKLEAGLLALELEIGNNERARAAFQQLREAIGNA